MYKKILKQNWCYLMICAVGLLIYLLISLPKHLHFGSTGYDLTIFDQAVRNYSNFQAPGSSIRGFDNLLGDHFHPILIILAPLYWIADSPITLLVTQALLIISATVPIYIFAKQKFGKIFANLMVATFILNPAILNAIYFDFHEIAFAIPLIAWAIYFIDKRLWRYFYISIILLLLVKEDMAVLVAFFGVYLLVIKKYKKGVTILLAGLIWFGLATKIFIPFFAGENRTYGYWKYSQFGDNLYSAALNSIIHPLKTLQTLVTPFIKVITLLRTVGMTLGISFFSPIMILAIPLLLERFLSSTENYWHFAYHYGATTIPIVIMATIDGISRIMNSKLGNKYIKRTANLPIMLATLFVFLSLILFAFSKYTTIFYPNNYADLQMIRDGKSILRSIPDDTSGVCTTNHIAPHLGKHNLSLMESATSNTTQNCDYIIFSTELDNSNKIDFVQNISQDFRYKLLKHSGSWYLYKKQ